MKFNSFFQNLNKNLKKYFFLFCIGNYCDEDGNYFQWKFHPLNFYINSGECLSAFIDFINEPERKPLNEREKALTDFIEDYWASECRSEFYNSKVCNSKNQNYSKKCGKCDEMKS